MKANVFMGKIERKKLVLVGLLVVVLTIAGVGVSWAWRYVGSSSVDEAKWLYLPDGTKGQALHDSLVNNLGAKSGERIYRLWSTLADDSASVHGAYKILPGMSAARVYRRLSTGAQTPVTFTFNNVRTIDQLSQRVASRMEMSSQQFLEACDSVLPSMGFSRAQYPAAFLPDSYEFYWTSSPVKVVKDLVGQYNRFWTKQRRDKASRLGLSPVEVATLASIAEEETNVKSERGAVARLYVNRLHHGMRLQADPTVKFALGDFSLKRVSGSHLNVASPYNTYRYPGLPPGPIRIPDAATLDAVLDAPQHDYIYMCAKEDFSGRHNFTASYLEHLRNAARYRAAFDARGIK